MSRIEDHRALLRSTVPARWPEVLLAASGLPGPRANLELVRAAALEASPELVEVLLAEDDEYLVMCGVVALGRLLAAGEPVAPRLRGWASDPRWRVREAVAMALQVVGDADPERTVALVRDWVRDDDPLVVRAAVAGVCEPRLLRGATARAALDVCSQATDALLGVPAAERRASGPRTLRRALGYCWSVAVAADPEAGLPVFGRLVASTDDDVRWVVRENRRKARLARLLPGAHRPLDHPSPS